MAEINGYLSGFMVTGAFPGAITPAANSWYITLGNHLSRMGISADVTSISKDILKLRNFPNDDCKNALRELAVQQKTLEWSKWVLSNWMSWGDILETECPADLWPNVENQHGYWGKHWLDNIETVAKAIENKIAEVKKKCL